MPSLLESDLAWYQDLGVLPRRPNEFWPTRDHSAEERLNALVRLVAYASAASFMYRVQFKFVAFGMAAILVLSVVHARGHARWQGFAPSIAGGRGACRGPAECRVATGGAASSRGGSRSAQRLPSACTRSTRDNPFANMLLSDLARNPGRPPACKYDEHASLIRKNFNAGLVRNAFDIYEKENSQRQFMTMPVTTAAPDTVAFAQFCYGNAGRPTCKEDPSRCTGSFP
jgi:hypothetical protein